MKYTIDDIQIFILTHNRKQLCQEMLKSVLASTVCPHKIFICDNESTDGTNLLFSNYPNPRVQYVKTYGQHGNYKKVLQLAHTPYLAVFHDDDLIHPQYLEKCLAILNHVTSAPSLIASTATTFCQKEQILPELYKSLNNQVFITDDLPTYICAVQSAHVALCFPSAIYKRDYYTQCDHIQTVATYGKLSDTIVLCEMVKHGTVAILLDNGYFYRAHPQSDRTCSQSQLTPDAYCNFFKYLFTHSKNFKYLGKERVLHIAQEYYKYTNKKLTLHDCFKKLWKDHFYYISPTDFNHWQRRLNKQKSPLAYLNYFLKTKFIRPTPPGVLIDFSQFNCQLKDI